MDSQDLRNLYEAYTNVYEQQIGVPLKSASDRDAKNQLQKMIPKGEKVYTPKATLQNAAYEPEGDEIEEDIRTRDVSARGGFDPRFDKKPTNTGSGQVRTPGGPVRTPGGPVTTPRPTGPVAQAPKPAGGLLGKVDSTLRDVAGRVGGEIGATQGRGKFGNIFGIPEKIGRNRGTQQGQQIYDKAKETVGGLLKQDYEPDLFDVILEYLVAEGYADTNENALVIMANMSEEWRETIIEAEVVAAKGGVPGFMKVKPTKEGGFLGIGARTVNKPVPGSFRAADVPSQDAARYNNELDKRYSSDGSTDSTTASEIQRRAKASGSSGYMRVNNSDSIPNTGLPNRPTPQRASDQNRVRG